MRWLDRELEGKEFIETFIQAAALGAVTTTLRFTPFVVKLPIRPPALVAKQAMSVAVLTNNRLALGVGTSPWPEDYDIMGVDFARRGKRMDECMDIIRGLETGEYFEFHGEFYDIPKIKMTPAPTQPIPLLVGGHADAALRRGLAAYDRRHGWRGAYAKIPDMSVWEEEFARIAQRRPLQGPASWQLAVVSKVEAQAIQVVLFTTGLFAFFLALGIIAGAGGLAAAGEHLGHPDQM